MTKLYRKLLLTAGLCIWTCASAQDTLRVMSYNLRYGEMATMEEIGLAIREFNPDIVMLQECDWNTRRHNAPKQNGVEFVNVLAVTTEMFGVFGKSIDFCGGYYGIGLLSRYPIIGFRRHLLPNDGKTEQRSVLLADIELPSRKVVTAVCTHLEVSSSALRQVQVRFINRLLENNSYPLILAGDMNALPDSEEIGMLRESWVDCTDEEFTYSTESPSVKIDYIFARPQCQVRMIETERLGGHPDLSDHFPVLSVIEIR